jgi:hypothetical protein
MTRDPDPATMPDGGLLCAIEACRNSVHESDREFSRACTVELERRMVDAPPVTSPHPGLPAKAPRVQPPSVEDLKRQLRAAFDERTRHCLETPA